MALDYTQTCHSLHGDLLYIYSFEKWADRVFTVQLDYMYLGFFSHFYSNNIG